MFFIYFINTPNHASVSFLRDGACFSHLHFLCVCLLLSFLHVEIGREMKGWRDELENARGCLLSLFCHDWKRERALTSVGGFGPSTCLLMHPCGPCGIRESKMNKLTHFPLSSCHSFPLSILFICSPLLQSHFFYYYYNNFFNIFFCLQHTRQDKWKCRDQYVYLYMVCGFVLMYYLDNHLQLSWVIIEENLPFLLDVMLFFY